MSDSGGSSLRRLVDEARAAGRVRVTVPIEPLELLLRDDVFPDIAASLRAVALLQLAPVEGADSSRELARREARRLLGFPRRT